MKICFVGGFSGGGTEKITFTLVNELLSRYTEFDISVINILGHNASFALNENVDYIRLEEEYRLSVFSRIKGIRKNLLRIRPDIVISIEAMIGMYLIPALLGLQCKKICWDHANYYQTQGSRWMQIIRKIWLWYCDIYVLLTKRDMKNFKNFGRTRAKLMHIYNPIKLEYDSAIVYDLNSKTIISVGFIYPIKNFIIIPDIVRAIGKSFNGWQWLIFGEETEPSATVLKTKIKEYGLEDNIILKGRSNRIDDEYTKASIYALTSLQEGLPTVLLEAQLHGLPCVSFDIETGPDEIITNRENGYLVKAYDVDKYAEAIKALILDDNLRKQFGINAKQSVKRFDLDKTIQVWYNLLRDIYYGDKKKN